MIVSMTVPVLQLNVKYFQLQSLFSTVAACNRVVCGLKNSSRPINRLPPEILIHILKQLVSDEFDAHTFPHCAHIDARTAWSSTHRMRLLHVCQRWRHILLTTPDMWSTILLDQTFLSQADYFLDRADLHPLSVHALDDNGLSSLSRALPQLRKLRVASYHPTQATFLQQSAPQLECLDIKFIWDTMPNAAAPMLFSGQTRLRRLALDNVITLFPNPPINLTHLYLASYERCVTSGLRREAFRDLLHLLRSSPLLDTFILRRPAPWVPENNQNMAWSEDAVELQNLKRFCVGDAESGHILQLLSHMVLPAGLCMSFYNINAQNNSLSLFPPYCGPVLDDITSLEANLRSGLIASGIGASGSWHVQLRDVSSSFYSSMPRYHYELNIRRLMHLPFASQLTEVWLRGLGVTGPYQSSNLVSVRPLFEALKALQKLVIVQPMRIFLLDAINSLSTIFIPHSNIPCTHLHSLWISDLPSGIWTEMCDRIGICLKTRADSGFPLRDLQFQLQGTEREWVRDEDRDKLGQYVERVAFDAEFPSGIPFPPDAEETLYRYDEVCWPKWRR